MSLQSSYYKIINQVVLLSPLHEQYTLICGVITQIKLLTTNII